MKICIIGGSGFIGTRLTGLLLQSHDITILDKNLSAFYPDRTIITDIRDIQKLKQDLKGFDLIIHLAAEHSDDVSPIQLYYDVNVQGTCNVLEAMDTNGIHKLLYFSSVAVYGLNKPCPSETFPPDPFNHYGKSKFKAEEYINKWTDKNDQRMAVIIRPTVIFGERNRGNVFNLLQQVASGRFLRIGDGNNFKSMAYIGNMVAFVGFCLDSLKPGLEIYNYIDKPDLSINELIKTVEKSLNRKIPSIHVPFWIGMIAGYGFDIMSVLLRRKFSVSSVRIRKFCATTQFDSTKAFSSGFIAPYTLSEGITHTINFEFTGKRTDDINFKTE